MATDIEIFAGDTLDISVAVIDQAETPVDLNGSEILWQMAKSDWQSKPIALVTKSSAIVGEIVLGGTSFLVHLLSPDTEGMPAGNYYHEAQVTLADGAIGTVITGKFKIKANLVTPRNG